MLDGPIDPSGGWQLMLADKIGSAAEASALFAAFGMGLLFWLPLLGVALLISYFWSGIFSHARARPRDACWCLHAWIFSLLLPATMPFGVAALALSFGLVFGCHVFGGTGRYLVNPALLGLVFVAFAYPALVDPTAWLPGSSAATTWSVAAGSGAEGVGAAGTTLFDAVLGREIGAIGTPSALACLLGALYLIFTRKISAAVVVAGVAAVAIAEMSFGTLGWAWQLGLGNVAFLLAFVATDPTTQPRALAGRLAFGILFGALTIALRSADPSHPEGSWAALLLASLFIPLIDHMTNRQMAENEGQAMNARGTIQ